MLHPVAMHIMVSYHIDELKREVGSIRRNRER